MPPTRNTHNSNRREPVRAISLERVCKTFGKLKAVDEVSLTIPRGICYALLGPNGAGKTTLMRMIGAVLSRDSGQIDILGMDPWQQKAEVKTHLGVVMRRTRSMRSSMSSATCAFMGSSFGSGAVRSGRRPAVCWSSSTWMAVNGCRFRL